MKLKLFIENLILLTLMVLFIDNYYFIELLFLNELRKHMMIIRILPFSLIQSLSLSPFGGRNWTHPHVPRVLECLH